jgi:hypothetical protein
MKGLSRMLGVLGGTMLSVGALVATTPLASASHNVYPPGWNLPAQNVPSSSYEFRAGCGWGDYQRYWPDQAGCGSVKSHSMSYGPTIYQMEPQGLRYHRVD